MHDRTHTKHLVTFMELGIVSPKFVGPYIAPLANITEIDAGLDLLWRAGVDPSKVVMEEACKCAPK